MKLNPLAVIAAFLFFLTVAAPITCMAQNVPDPCAEVAQYKDFLALADKRAELLAESQQLTFDIAELKSAIPESPNAVELATQKKRLDDLQKKPTRTALEEEAMQNLEVILRNLRSDKEITDDIAQKNAVLAKDKFLLQCIQGKISQLTSPEQKFRTDTSWVFAGLISAVIIGFFVLAFKDEVMRRAIFSGETGIQFLTLFSVVIAIILFGIINILEGKELAALLGGLSGYILGRTSQRSATPAPPTTTPTRATVLQKFIKDLNSITVSPSSASLSSTSKAFQLVAEPKDIKGAVIRDDDKLFVPEWESSDPAVAKVDQSGLVSMVGPGTANVTASYGNIKSDPCEVTCT
jgi:hypothetical protein